MSLEGNRLRSPERNGSRSEASRRILVVAPEPFYENRGTPIALKKVLEAASQRGFEADLLTFPVGENVGLPGLRIFRVGTWLPIGSVPIGFSIRKVILDAFLLPEILRRTTLDKYRFIYALEEAAFLALLLKRWHGLPVLYDMQSSLPEQLKAHPVLGVSVFQRVLRFFERWMIRQADQIVCSAGLRTYVQAVEPAARVREWYFPREPDGPDTGDTDRLRKELGIDPESRVILYTGNFEPYQGVTRLLDAVPAVVSEIPNAVFLLVGNHAASHISLPKTADALRRQGVLRMLPTQPKSEIRRYLAMADVVVSPRDDTSNVGIKVFEYMSAGKPIVATDTPAHRKVLAEDRAVLVALSPKDIGSAIVRLLRDRATSNRLGESARAYAEKNLSWSAFADQVADLCNPSGG